MVLVSGSPQNDESRCVIEETWSSIVNTEVLFSRNYLCMGRKNSKELHFPSYWHSSVGRTQSKCDTITRSKPSSLPKVVPVCMNSCSSLSSTFRGRGIALLVQGLDSRDWANPNISPVSADPFSQVQAVLPHTHVIRAEELPANPQLCLWSCSPATIPNVSERLFWMKMMVQFYPLCRSLYFW